MPHQVQKLIEVRGAREHRAWWTSQESAIGQKRDCVGVGWRVAQADLGNGRATFARARR